jgi:subtilase family serine protease
MSLLSAPVILCLLVLVVGGFTSKAQAYSQLVDEDIQYVAGPTAKPKKVAPTNGEPRSFPYTSSQCQTQFGISCYTPAQIRSAYNVPKDLTGSGQTIAIVVAYGSPTVEEDLRAFSEEFGLPDARLNIFYPEGRPRYNPERNPEQLTWAAETSLDVQWAHAIAPEARINLVVAPRPKGSALNAAQRYVVKNRLGDVMSLSFGSPEGSIEGKGNNLKLQQAHKIYQDARKKEIGVFAAAGNEGAENGYAVPNALYPASDPLVTAVGGTALFVNDQGEYEYETAWNDTDPDMCPFGCRFGLENGGATGGAPSRIFHAPRFQAGLSKTRVRTTSDVAYGASDYTGVLVYLGYLDSGSGFYFLGGTSAGAPQWAGIAALANERAGRPLGYLNPSLYGIGADPVQYGESFRDVSRGHNGITTAGFQSGPGYDEPTGLGTPNTEGLIRNLMSR